MMLAESHGEEFIFLSKGEALPTIERFLDDNKLTFRQDEWEYPLIYDDSPEAVLSSFEEVVCYVMERDGAEYIFYPSGDLRCWFGLARDKSVIFGVRYRGESPKDLADFAKRYHGKYGFVTNLDAPDLSGDNEASLSYMPIAYKSDGFTLYGEQS